jgi:hypothetical protein
LIRVYAADNAPKFKPLRIKENKGWGKGAEISGNVCSG